MNDSNATLKMIGALLVGAAIGGTLGILFAPDKGSDTRKKIVKKGENYSDAVKEKINEILDTMADKFENKKDELAEKLK